MKIKANGALNYQVIEEVSLMAVIFVHGVPDTYRVWNQVVSRLERSDVVTLRLPGFDSPLPEGFNASK